MLNSSVIRGFSTTVPGPLRESGLRCTLASDPQRAEQDPSYRLLARYLLHFPWAVWTSDLMGASPIMSNNATAEQRMAHP